MEVIERPSPDKQRRSLALCRRVWKAELALAGCRSREGQAAKKLFSSGDGISVLEEKQLEELLKWGLLMGVRFLKSLLHKQG